MYRIITDITSDLPKDYIEKNDLGIMELTFSIGDKHYDSADEIEITDFYQHMRDGEATKTSQPSPAKIKELIEESLEKYEDGVLVCCLSSGISGTYSTACMVRDMILDDNPEAKIVVIDSLSASLGEGLLVDKLLEKRREGASLEECAKYAEELAKHVIHCFIVDDLMFLARGGRIKKTKAVAGTIINLKPMLRVDDEGKLENFENHRGRKKTINAMVDYFENNIGSFRDKNEYVFIGHGDCLQDAEYLAEKIKERTGIETKIINYIGMTIGSHSGPGTLALFFLGDKR